MKLKELLNLMHNSERLILADAETKEELEITYVGCVAYHDNDGYTDREVKAMQLCTDIWHRDYIARGLLPPEHGDVQPDVIKGDLNIAIYQKVFI